MNKGPGFLCFPVWERRDCLPGEAAGELGLGAGSAALRGASWTSFFLPLGLSFSTCTLMGFSLSTCCVLGTRAVCKQDKQFLPSEADILVGKTATSIVLDTGFCSEQFLPLWSFHSGQGGRRTNIKTAVAGQRWKQDDPKEAWQDLKDLVGKEIRSQT